MVAYKVGFMFASTPSQEKEIKYLKVDSGTNVMERFDYLDRVISNSVCDDKTTQKNLYRITRAVYDEARSIAQTAEQRKHAERYKKLADEALVNRNKKTMYDKQGRFINVDPNDSFRPEDLK